MCNQWELKMVVSLHRELPFAGIAMTPGLWSPTSLEVRKKTTYGKGKMALFLLKLYSNH